MKSKTPLLWLKARSGEAFHHQADGKDPKMLEAKLEKLRATDRKDDVITFEQLGVDRLFVDETHFQEPVPLHKNAQCRRYPHRKRRNLRICL